MIDKCEICGKEAHCHEWSDKENRWIERCNKHWDTERFKVCSCSLDKWMEKL